MKNNKFLIFGNGWLGNLLNEYLKLNGQEVVVWLGDITKILRPNPAMIEADIWINTAAKTNIDWCEKNKLETLGINALAAVNLASLAKENRKKYVFISSACIFESKDRKDIKWEDSKPNPACFYSLSKWLAEELILEENPKALIVRPRLPISSISHSRNTLNKLLRYEYLNDNQESVTVIDDMIPVLYKLISQNKFGIYHLINKGTISPKELGILLGHKFKIWKKKYQDSDMLSKGRAKRVTTYVGSKKIEYLPDIRKRAKEIAKLFKETM